MASFIELIKDPTLTALLGAATGAIVGIIGTGLVSFLNNKTLLKIKKMDKEMETEKLIYEMAYKDHHSQTNLLLEIAKNTNRTAEMVPTSVFVFYYKKFHALLLEDPTHEEFKKEYAKIRSDLKEFVNVIKENQFGSDDA